MMRYTKNNRSYFSKIIMNSKRFSYGLLMAAAMANNANADTHAHGITDGANLPATADYGYLKQSATPFMLSDEQIEQLSEQVLWQRLLLLPDDFAMSRRQKLVGESDFFLSDSNGKPINAKDELVAMLSAIEQGDQVVLCRFPARAHFLANELAKLGVSLAVSDDGCADFHAWVDDIAATRLSLVFAEEHGNNLASAFAHTFMRIDSREDDATGQFATAMNYTVKAEPSDGVLSGAIKPLIGGYAGVMEILPYSVKANDYLVKDERDLWEYRLDLSDAEVDQIMRHIWEVRNLARPYYLTHDNCATEIVRLVDVVRADKSIFAKLGAVTTPAKIAQLLQKEGMITHTHYHPSKSTQRQALINNGADFDLMAIKPNDNNPTKASPIHRLGLGVLYDERHGAAYHLSVRSAYQDWLDRPSGVRKFHEVVLPSIDIKHQDGKMRLDELTIFKTTSLNPTNTAKAYADGQSDKKALATQVYLGVRQTIDASDWHNDTHTVLDARLQKGKSWAVGQGAKATGDLPDAVCYVLGGGGVQLGRVNQGYRVGVQTSVGCIHHHTDRLRTVGEIAVPYWYHHDSIGRSGYVQPSVALGMQYDLDRHHALRINGLAQKNHHKHDHSLRIEWLAYF
ncbi:DUF4105 domain-containing protein [Moraxella nasibovis]|uniref:Lnb N-terminal periplasmic domain-containing protein n=1 Tax=Moraxella nasibovis TaxID=2904120 RepID=UPI00240F7871|nr:DUF4105 domain-containing protein [Moraxella nasibovis]WFF38146.1 DUF4105 domain-containing protein [Moraxella nasibovis]